MCWYFKSAHRIDSYEKHKQTKNEEYDCKISSVQIVLECEYFYNNGYYIHILAKFSSSKYSCHRDGAHKIIQQNIMNQNYWQLIV